MRERHATVHVGDTSNTKERAYVESSGRSKNGRLFALEGLTKLVCDLGNSINMHVATNHPSAASVSASEGDSAVKRNMMPAVAPEKFTRTAGGESARDISPEVYKKGFLVLLLLGCIIRVGYFIEHSHTPAFAVPTLDQKYYDTVARMLVAGDDLRQLHGFKPLLYPIFLATLYKTTGSAALPLAIVIQHGLGIATGLIVALLAARVFRNKLAGLLAGAIYMIAPLPLMFEGELLVESSYTFLICVALLVHLYAIDKQYEAAASDSTHRKLLWLWILGGSLVVLAAQARPNVLIFLAFYPLFTVWRLLRSRARPTATILIDALRSSNGFSALVPLLGLIGALPMAAVWGVVNLKQSAHFHLLPSAGGVNLYLGNKRGSKGTTAEQERRVSYSDRYQDPIEVWAREEYASARRAEGRNPQDDPIAISKYWTSRAIEEIRADPGAWLQLLARKSWLMLWNTEIPNNKSFAFFQQESVWLRWLPIRWVLLLALAVPGVWWAATRGNRDALFLVTIFIALYSVGNVAFFISDRYRYPIWPAMAALASGGVLALLQGISCRNVRAIALYGFGMLTAAAVSLPNWGHVQLPSFARDYFFRSIAWYEKGRFPEALDDVDRSLKLDPSDPSALQQRGILLFALDRFADSKTSFEQALKVSPGEAVTWNNLGVVYERLGETNQAVSAFTSATTCQPPSRNAFINLASLQLRLSRYEAAHATISSLEKIAATPDASTLALKSVLARRTGDIATADSLESQARSLDKDATSWILQKTGSAVP